MWKLINEKDLPDVLRQGSHIAIQEGDKLVDFLVKDINYNGFITVLREDDVINLKVFHQEDLIKDKWMTKKG